MGVWLPAYKESTKLSGPLSDIRITLALTLPELKPAINKDKLVNKIE